MRYSAGVDNTGLDAEEQREIHDRSKDVATVNLMVRSINRRHVYAVRCLLCMYMPAIDRSLSDCR